MQIKKRSAFWFSIHCKYGKPSDIQPGGRISLTVERPNVKDSVLSQDTGWVLDFSGEGIPMAAGTRGNEDVATPPDSTRIKNNMTWKSTTVAQPRSSGLIIRSTGKRITWKTRLRNLGDEKLRDKKTIEKRLCLFYTKFKKYFAQIKATQARINYRTPELTSHQTQNVHALAD